MEGKRDLAGSDPAAMVVVSRRVVTANGVGPAAIGIRGGRIVGLSKPGEVGGGREVLDVGEDVVMPGLVDTHVHINEPGRTEWEGFATATRAAAAGGVTTVVDMPLNSSPATTNVVALEAKVAAAEGKARVDFGFWGGVIPGNLADLAPMARAGVLGFKCFMVDSGLEEFPPVAGQELETAMREISALGSVLLAHAEAPEPIEAAGACLDRDPRSYAAYLSSRPPEAEEEAIRGLLAKAEATGCRIHIVHLATHTALGLLRRAKASGDRISVETCPHYLHFTAEEIEERSRAGQGVTLFKCAPPIRQGKVREGLWQGLAEGVIGMVASDHSPCPPDLKKMRSGDLPGAWGGIASLQLTLPVLWTEASSRGFGFAELSRWLSTEPSRLAGLVGVKGRIAPGYDADLVIWNPEKEFQVAAGALHHRHPLTPYLGRRLKGVVSSTWLRGGKVYSRPESHQEHFADPPRGTWLRGNTLAGGEENGAENR